MRWFVPGFAAAPTIAVTGARGDVGEHYAESVALMAVSPDGTSELSVRLARFPARGVGTLWMHVKHRGNVYSLVDEHVDLAGFTGATAIRDPEVRFVGGGASESRFVSRARDTARMVGEVESRMLAQRTAHPDGGAGTVPMRITARFEAAGRGVRLNGGTRNEIFGRVSATVETPEATFTVELPGKWHDQVGDRPNFAPKFTYLAVEGNRLALLAIGFDAGATGYLSEGGASVAVDTFTIDPLGAPQRCFRVTLDDGSVIDGIAKVVQDWSVPIDGHRRPGATVLVESNRGAFAGTLNDWDPPARTTNEEPDR